MASTKAVNGTLVDDALYFNRVFFPPSDQGHCYLIVSPFILPVI